MKPFMFVVILVLLALLLVAFWPDLFGGDSKFRVGDSVKIIAEDRIGIVQQVKHIPIAWKSKETTHSYLVWYVEGGKVLKGGKWCSDEELVSVPHPFN